MHHLVIPGEAELLMHQLGAGPRALIRGIILMSVTKARLHMERRQKTIISSYGLCPGFYQVTVI